MIEVTYHGRDLPRMEIKGHSSYASAGTDIVCSAVSVLTQFVAEILKNEGLGEYEKNAGYLLIKASKNVKYPTCCFTTC